MKKQFAIFLTTITFLTFGIFVLTNQVHAETEVSGNITSDTIWTSTNSPYTVTQTVQILEGVTLEIEPGVIVNFNPSTALVIGGKLIAIGNKSQKITFLGGTITFTDKSIGAITDQNNNYISGSIIKYSIIESGKAIGLNIDSSPFISDNIIKNYVPNGAGVYAINLHHSKSVIINNLIDNNSGTAINVYFSDAKIRNNIITNNLTAFEISGGTSEISRNTVKNNNYGGFYLQFGANPKIQYNNIFQNGTHNNDVMANNNLWMAQNTDIKADHNYWGTAEISLINTNIHDYYDNIGLGKVDYEPYALTELKFDGTDTFSQPPTCSSWTYSDWSSCSNGGQQTRSIVSSSPSDCSGGDPVLTQGCTYIPLTCTSWAYSDWNTCVDNQQNRTIISSQPENCTGGNPILNQDCDSTPLCTEDNWISVLSPTICPSNEQQVKKWTKIGQCQNGISYSSEETVSCDYQTPTCTSFTYGDWDACSSSGVQSRTILSTFPSVCASGNSILSRTCDHVPPCTSDTWSCGDWSDCSTNDSQTRICAKTFDCPDAQTVSPIINQSCEAPNKSAQQVSQNNKESQTDQIQGESNQIKNNEQGINQEKNGIGSQAAEQRINKVSDAIKEVLQVAEKDSGIGEQVKIIAQAQTQNQEKLETSLQKVQSRSGFAKFFVGSNYNEINNAKKLLEQNREQIKKFNQVKNQFANQGDQQKLAEQIQLLEQTNQEVENTLNTSQKGFSLFGWIFRLFVK